MPLPPTSFFLSLLCLFILVPGLAWTMLFPRKSLLDSLCFPLRFIHTMLCLNSVHLWYPYLGRHILEQVANTHSFYFSPEAKFYNILLICKGWLRNEIHSIFLRHRWKFRSKKKKKLSKITIRSPVLWVESLSNLTHPLKKIGWYPNPQYLRLWPYLEIRFLQMQIVELKYSHSGECTPNPA